MTGTDSSDWLGLSGRVCVVTGGGGGIGRATAVSFAQAGARVAAIEGRSAEALTQIRRAMALLEVTDNTLQLARGYLLSAGIESQEGRLDETREQLEIAERLLGTAPDPGDLGVLRIGQSRLASLDGDGDAAVESVAHLHTMFLGPHEVLLTIELRFRNEISALEVRKAVRRMREAIQSQHPDVRRIFFGSEYLSEDGDISQGHND